MDDLEPIEPTEEDLEAKPLDDDEEPVPLSGLKAKDLGDDPVVNDEDLEEDEDEDDMEELNLRDDVDNN